MRLRALESLGVAGPFRFPSVLLSARTSIPVNASGPQRLGGRYSRGPTQKRELGTERNGSGDRCTTDVPKPPRNEDRAVRSTEWVGDISRLKINDLEIVGLTGIEPGLGRFPAKGDLP